MFAPRQDRFEEPELTVPIDECTPDGRLNRAAVGWARRPLLRCNVTGQWPRKKKWNYWCLTSDRYLFSTTIANVDYIGLAGAYFYDRETGRFLDRTVITPFGSGCAMPETVLAPVRFTHPRLNVDLAMGERGGRITVDSPDFEGTTLSATFDVAYPAGHETLNVVIPWSDRRFQFTGKHNCLPAQGEIRLNNETLAFTGDNAFACLDYGRGVWPYNTIWNWGAASGHTRGHLVGLNLGGKWTDGTGMTENALCVDGRLTKIGEDLRWDYDPADWMRPWRIQTPVSDRIDLTFTPRFDRANADNYGIIRTAVHQMFGEYSGRIVTDDRLEVDISNLFGWAEEHQARW